MMSDTCGLTSCEPFAKWDPDSQCWRTSEVTSLWALTLSSLTLPQWGGLHNGELCEHPTPELATSGPAYSSLPTPRTLDTNGAGSHGGGGPDLRTAVTMLPTPRAQDEYERRNMKTMKRIRDEGGDMTLPTWAKVVVPLLPTPRAQNGEERNSNIWARPLDQPQNLENALALLPTPTSQAAKHGETPDTTANGFGSNLWDLPSLLPTPTSRDHKGLNQRGDATCLHGAITAPLSPDGSASQDDQPQHQLSLDELALPA